MDILTQLKKEAVGRFCSIFAFVFVAMCYDLAAQDTSAPLDEVSMVVEEPVEEPRDPFWPVGYTPQSDQPVTAAVAVAAASTNAAVEAPDTLAEKLAKARKQLRIGGILRQGDQFVAVVNGQTVEKGETVTVEYDGSKFQFVVRELTAQNVSLEPAEDYTAPRL